MSHAFPRFTAFCLLLGACSGGRHDAGAATGTPGDGNAGAAAATAGSGDASFAGSVTGNDGGGTSASGGVSNGGNSAVTSGGSAAQTGGASAQAGSMAAQGGNSASGIDFSIWSLQLPIGSGTSPTTITPSQLTAGYTSDYFYVAPDGGRAFMDPQTGITTSGSQHCRTEMREDDATGAQAAWSGAGTNTLTVTGEVIQVGGGASGHVTVGQVFNATDSIPLCELIYATSTGGFQTLYEEAKGSGTTTDLAVPVALGAQYNFTLALSNGVLSVSINGKQMYTHTPSTSIGAKKFYFKFGNYDQTAIAGAVSTTPYTVIEAYSVGVVHQ